MVDQTLRSIQGRVSRLVQQVAAVFVLTVKMLMSVNTVIVAWFDRLKERSIAELTLN